MTDARHLVVAVDIGATTLASLSAAKREQALLAEAGAAVRVTVLHVMPDLGWVRPLFPQFAAGGLVGGVDLEVSIRRFLDDRVREVGLDNAEVVVEKGEPARQIAELAERLEASRIVMSARAGGETGVADRVIRYSQRPVLLNRGSTQTGPILVATDLSDRALLALRAGQVEARRRKRPLVALHVVETHLLTGWLGAGVAALAAPQPMDTSAWLRTASDVLKASVATEAPDAECEVLAGRPAETIIARAAARDASLLVISTHGRTGWDRALVGSTAEVVTRQVGCSVLVVRRGEDL